jgi:FixJ family two-component response regulator
LSLCGYAVEGYETTCDFLNAHPAHDGAVILLEKHLPQQTGLGFSDSVVLMTGQGELALVFLRSA